MTAELWFWETGAMIAWFVVATLLLVIWVIDTVNHGLPDRLFIKRFWKLLVVLVVALCIAHYCDLRLHELVRLWES